MLNQSTPRQSPRSSCLIRCGVLSALLVASLPGSLAAQANAILPVVGGELSGPSFQIEVTRIAPPAPNERAWQDAAEQLAQGTLPTSSAMAAAQYLSLLASQNLGAAQRLYSVEERESPLALDLSRFLAGKLKPLEPLAAVRVLETWRYGAFELVLVEALSSNGRAEIFSLGTRQHGAQFVRSDNWGPAQDVLHLFWYITGNRRNHLSWPPRTAPWDLSFELTPDTGSEVLRVHLQGQLYPPAESWTPGQQEPTAREFAHRVAETIESSDDEAFLLLWASQDREQLLQLYAQAPGGFHGLQQALAPQDLRDVFTAELGEVEVHYFLDPASPDELRALWITRQDGTRGLTRDLHPNLEAFLMSEAVRQAILQRWRESADSTPLLAARTTTPDHTTSAAAATTPKRATR